MSILDRIRELFGGKRSSAEYGAVAGGAVAATSGDDQARDVESPDSGGSGGGDGGGWGGWGGDGGSGGGGDGDGGGGS